MATVTTKNEDNTEKYRSREEWMEMYDNLYEKKHHGHLDYPFSVYTITMNKSYLNYIHWHWHEEMEVVLVTDGNAEVSTDDMTLILEAGQGALINQNVMHSIRPVDGKDCSLHTVVFHPDFIFGHKSTNLQTQYLLPMHNLHLLKILKLDPQDSWHKEMMDTIYKAVSLHVSHPFGYEIAVMSQVCQFWFLLVSKLPNTDPAPAPKISLDEQRVKQAMLFMRTHYAEPLSLSEIAESVHISKSECCRCFARTLQMSPFEYLMKCRIFEATRTLLENPDSNMAISELSTSVGFNNTSYFNKVFKKYLGCTPTYYRTHHVPAVENQGSSPFAIPPL